MEEASSSLSPPIYRLPEDTLHQIFSHLSLRQIAICKSVSKLFNQTLSSPSFTHLLSSQSLSSLHLIALRPSHHHHHSHHQRHASLDQCLHAYDTDLNLWLRFSLDFLPFQSPVPITSSLGLLYLWADSPDSSKSLIVCNPLTRQFKVLPQLGSAWSKHGSVLTGSAGKVIVLTELAALFFSGSNQWLKFSSNLPSKPRSPILVFDSIFAICDVGSPWRSQWKLFFCPLTRIGNSISWSRLERPQWTDVFDILKRPRLIPGVGNKLLMIGGLKSSFSPNTPCLTILILRLDLETLHWDEAGRMPQEMFCCFQESSKFKVFGCGSRVCFSAKRIGKLALWDCSAENGKGKWKWIENVPRNGDGLCRGFVFEAKHSALP